MRVDAHTAAGTLDRLFRRISQLAPNARVYVAGYPDLIPNEDCEAESDLSDDDIQGLKSLVDPLNDAIQGAVQRAGRDFTFVDVRQVWVGHEVCSDDTWVNGIQVTDPDASYHPNAQGQRAYEQTVFQTITGAPAPAPSTSSS